MYRIAIFIGLFWGAANLSPAQIPQASYTFEQTTHDFGTIRANETQTAVFTLTNHSTTPLTLTRVTASCRCSKISWPRRPILPGKSAELTVTYKDRNPGAFYKIIEVKTNGTPAETRLTLKGTVEKQPAP
jgi:hypothetical protein